MKSQVNFLLQFLFLFLGFCCVYSYFLYPLVLRMLPPRGTLNPPAELSEKVPSLSLIITAHNEASRIQSKLENTLQLDYPGEQLEIIIASDCSTDETDEIVTRFHGRNVNLVRADTRKGKEYAQLCAIRQARGDILVFSDVATRLEASAMRKLARWFGNAEIGAISSVDHFISQAGGEAGEGIYVRYEMWLRRLESSHAGLVGLSGSFFAARRCVCENWDISVPSDFNTALNCARLNLTAISCPDIIGNYEDVKDPDLEYRRKLRTVIRGMAAIAQHPEVLNPLRMGLFAFQIWGHKIMRWGVPWFMLGFLGLSLALVDRHWFYALATFAQFLFYMAAMLGHVFKYLRAHTLFKIPYFFVQVNIAILHATLQFICGRRITVWEPSRR